MSDGSVPRIDLRLLRQFVAVAEELHFHRAARRLAMSQPPLTASIRRIEAEIGAELIERGRKTVRLTPAGKVLLEEARLLLAAADRAIGVTRDVAAGCRGHVRMGYVGSAMYGRLPSCLRAFRESEPEVRIDLHEMTTAAQLSALRAGTVDLAIIVPPVAEPGGLGFRLFDHDRLAIALPRLHPKARAAAIDLIDLADQEFVMWPRTEGFGFHDLVIRLCSEAGFVPRVVQEAHGMHAVLALVAAGVGVAIVPAGMSDLFAAQIAFIPIEADAAAFELHLCRRAEQLSPAAARLEENLLR